MNLKRALMASLVLALALGWAAPDARAQRPGRTDGAEIAAAEADVAARRYGRAAERYRAIVARAGAGPDALRLALRLAEIANAAGMPAVALEALAGRMSQKSAGQTGELAERALESLLEAASTLQRHDQAVAYGRRLVQAREERLGEVGPTQAARLNLSIALEKAGAADEARALRRTALGRLEREDPDVYGRLVNNTAIVLQNGGQLDSAAEMFGLLLASLAREPESIGLGITHFNAAILDRERRRFDQAVAHHVKAIEILERLKGRMSEETIAAVGGLGQTYAFAGRPAAALPLLRDAYTRAGQALGQTDDTMLQANNLAAVLRELGQFAEAAPLDRTALGWREAHFGDAHEATLISRKNLALDLIGLGQAEAAQREYGAVVATLERTRGRNHPTTRRVARERDMLAMLTGAAAPAGAKIAAPDDDVEPSADSVQSANLLAGIAEKLGDAVAELRLHRLALKLAEAHYGELHPRTLAMLTNVARTERQARAADAVDTYRKLEQRLRLWSRREIASTDDEATLEQVAATTRETLGDILSFARAAMGQEPAAADLFATALLEWKTPGSLERTLLDAAARTLAGADLALLRRVRELRAETLQRPRAPGSLDAAGRELVIAETRLADRVAGLRRIDEARRRPYREILAALEPTDAVVDYIVVRLKAAGGVLEDRIFAMVGRRDASLAVADLGPLAGIEPSLSDPEASGSPAAREKLYGVLMRPLEASLEGAERVFVVPDGILHLVPFDGLLDGQGRNLVERYDLRLARSAAAVTGGASPDPALAGGPMLLLGDVDYGPGQAIVPLPATGTEIETVAEIMRKAGFAPELLRGKAAGETATRSAVAGRRVLHLATHGFFNPVSPKERAPLWRAGIALVGANAATESRNPADDGIAHAAEIAAWPLAGVELVVLSACDTAQGDRSYVEGLSGLPSALAAAGAKRSLLARWPVDDAGAALFMRRFYEHLAETRSPEKAFRQTKRDAIAGRIAGAPEDIWLPFALIAN